MTAEDFPRPLRVYAVGLAFATVVLGAFLISRAELPRGNQLGLALFLTALVTITAQWRVKIVSSSYDMTLDFGPVIAALILFNPGVAMVIAFVGTLVSELLRRKRPIGVGDERPRPSRAPRQPPCPHPR